MGKTPRWIPSFQASSIYDIPVSFYAQNGIKIILSDLDNTLDAHDVKDPGARALKLVDTLKEAGITLFIASNNTSRRVERYAKGLGVMAFCGLWKPFSGPLNKLIARQGFSKSEVILIGDQIMTDVKAGNGAGIRTLLVDPLTTNDPFWTKINRILEKKKRKRLTKEPYNSKGRKI